MIFFPLGIIINIFPDARHDTKNNITKKVVSNNLDLWYILNAQELWLKNKKNYEQIK